MKRILVTGATGHIGRRVVEQLLAAGSRVRAMSRSPHTAGLPDDVEVVRGDLTEPATLDPCLDGVDAVFLVWAVPLAGAAAAVERIAAHAERIVLLTSPHRTPHPFFQQPNTMRAVHAGVEQVIETSGLQWTFLRPHVFALNYLNWWAPQIKTGNVVRWFHAAAATAPIHERDLAAAAARALCDEGHAGKEYVLTGPASLTQRELPPIIGDAIGRPLRFEELSPESARREVLAQWPAWLADMMLSAYGAAVDRPAFVTSTVADVTGSPARTFRQWAVEHAADFRC
jgi:uncharacterized protein YbjT (DUF2867 family)